MSAPSPAATVASKLPSAGCLTSTTAPALADLQDPSTYSGTGDVPRNLSISVSTTFTTVLPWLSFYGTTGLLVLTELYTVTGQQALRAHRLPRGCSENLDHSEFGDNAPKA